MKGKVLCFGELLLRMDARSLDFESQEASNMVVHVGGSEINVCAGLLDQGIETEFFSALPENMLADKMLSYIEKKGIGFKKMLRQGDKVGMYFLLSANGLSNGEVIYDRCNSSFSQMKIDSINWDALFEEVGWLHFSALNPALNAEMASLCLKMAEEARKRAVVCSIDLNYRNKLWKYGKSPIEVMPDMVYFMDVIMGNIWAAHKMLGTTEPYGIGRDSSVQDMVNTANNITAEIMQRFPNCQHVAHTFRFMDSATHNLFFGTYHDRHQHVVSEVMETNAVLDRIGSGDAFMSGLIGGILKKKDAQEIVRIATNRGFNKLFKKGDF